MDSETLSTLNNNIKNHLPVQSNGLISAPDPPKQPFVIGVAGGTASGKTTVCNMIISQLHDQRVVLVNQDSFYHSLSDDTLAQVYDYNFDHPDAFNTELLLSCMEKLKNGRAVNIPNYDFQTHKRIGPGWKVNPSDIIILEGILVLHDPRVRDLMNMKIFVDTGSLPLSYSNILSMVLVKKAIKNSVKYSDSLWGADSDLRLARRIQRDTVERGRNIQNVLDQYARSVKPSFEEFILPSKKYADVIIPRGGDNDVAIDLIIQHIRAKLGQHHLCKIYPNVSVIHSTFQMRGMHTLVRDVKTTKHDFVFYADRLIRLVVEHGLGHLPFTEKQITTPTGSIYPGVVFCKRLCGVSVIRSGESMENALRACCKGIKIGKILIHGEGNNGRQLIYEKLPADISSRHVLLLDPVLASGNSAVKAINLLLSKGVVESNIIFLNLIAAPQGIHVVCKKFPKLKIVTSEIDVTLDEDLRVIPGMGEFGDRYFGTNN
ncbi:uridine kinase-like protein 5 [Populus alba x Populus x berolinensis]|nr:uridine kinase-like protein 5 [Populus alba x Populus x berolinensis]